jgi:hypothetical protein
MSRGRSNIFIVIPVAAGIGAAILLGRLLHETPRKSALPREQTSAAGTEPSAARGVGQVRLAMTLPSDSGLSSLSYAVVSVRQVVVARGNAAVEQQSGVVATQALSLPGGEHYTLSVIGNSDAGGVKRAVYLGSHAFEVVAGQEAPVSFAPNAGVDRSAGELPGAAVAAGDSTSTGGALACQSCELSSGQGICDSPNVTATSSTDPRTGEQTGVGWGCGTLADAKARSACLALLHCLNVNGCGHPGENPVTGCYCGAAPAEDCMAGQGIDGACIAEYQAAAVASPGGPATGAGSGQISQFIATESGDPTTPVGLANNIKHCATETHCDACQTL